MTFKNLMIAEMLVSIGFGLIYIVYPQYLADEYLIDKSALNSTTKLIAMSYGSLCVVIGIVQFLCRNAQPSLARRAILFIPLLSNLFIVIISFYGLSTGIENNMIWSVIILLGAMAGWAGWLMWKERGVGVV